MEHEIEPTAIPKKVARPVYIAMQARSGSSMTAGIFALHGFWVGSHRLTSAANPKGSFENLELKKVFKKYYPNLPLEIGVLAEPNQSLRSEIELTIARDGYTGGPWLWKASVMYWPAFHVMNPRYVCVFRRKESIFASNRTTRMFGQFLPDAELRENIQVQQDEMHDLCQHQRAYPVYTDELIEGNYASIERAITGLGFAFNRAAVEEFIDPLLWRHG